MQDNPILTGKIHGFALDFPFNPSNSFYFKPWGMFFIKDPQDVYLPEGQPSNAAMEEGPQESHAVELVLRRAPSMVSMLSWTVQIARVRYGGFQLRKWGYPQLAGWFLLGKIQLKWMMIWW